MKTEPAEISNLKAHAERLAKSISLLETALAPEAIAMGITLRANLVAVQNKIKELELKQV